MSRSISLLAAAAATLASLAPLSAITIDTVPVGNPGNAPDTTGYGSVAYTYRVATTEVTIGQYTAFLNAVAATDTYGLYSPFMTSDAAIAGIARSGSPGSYTYSAIGTADRPITYVGLGDAFRFANWLHNNQPSGLQNLGTTESGAYFLNGATTDGALSAVVRSVGAKWFVPSENEWYKSAYHKNDGATGNYWDYPTASDAVPAAAAPPGGTNAANYLAVLGGLSLAGAYITSPGPYETFDQGGNVWEWVEYPGHGLPGGAWTSGASFMLSSNRSPAITRTTEDLAVGFRVAMVPEPSAIVLAVLSTLALLGFRST